MVYLRQLLKFTDSEHFLSVAVAERPEPVDGSGLADLHVDAGGVRLHRDRPAFPEQILNLQISDTSHSEALSLPVCPQGRGSIPVAGTSTFALPLEDANVLRCLTLQAHGVLAEGFRVVELVVHVRDQTIQLRSGFQSNQMATRRLEQIESIGWLSSFFREYWDEINWEFTLSSNFRPLSVDMRDILPFPHCMMFLTI